MKFEDWKEFNENEGEIIEVDNQFLNLSKILSIDANCVTCGKPLTLGQTVVYSNNQTYCMECRTL